LVVLHPGLDLGHQQPSRGLVPLDPAGVLDVFPPPLPHPPERRVRATEVALRFLEQGLQPRVDPRPGDDLHDFHAWTLPFRLWAVTPAVSRLPWPALTCPEGGPWPPPESHAWPVPRQSSCTAACRTASPPVGAGS